MTGMRQADRKHILSHRLTLAAVHVLKVDANLHLARGFVMFCLDLIPTPHGWNGWWISSDYTGMQVTIFRKKITDKGTIHDYSPLVSIDLFDCQRAKPLNHNLQSCLLKSS